MNSSLEDIALHQIVGSLQKLEKYVYEIVLDVGFMATIVFFYMLWKIKEWLIK